MAMSKARQMEVNYKKDQKKGTDIIGRRKRAEEFIASKKAKSKTNKANSSAQGGGGWDAGGRNARNDGPQRSSGGGNVDRKTFTQRSGGAPSGESRKSVNAANRKVKQTSNYRQAKAAGLKTIRKTKVGKVALRHKGKIGLGLAAAGAGYAGKKGYDKYKEGKTVKGRIKKAYKKVKDKMN